jgi:hypothetical protein
VNEYCRRVLRAACAALLLAGCAQSRPPDPAAGLKSIADRLAHQPGDAWTVERHQLADRLRAAAQKRAVTVHAEVESGGQVAGLAWEDERWRLTSVRPTARGAPTPEEALRRFTAALEAHDLDSLLHLLGEPLKSLVERELADRLAGLRAIAGKPVATDGDHAQIRYDASHHLDLRRENGQWQVVDFN